MTANVVAAEFAVGGLPSAKRLRGRGNAGRDAKRVQEAVRRQRAEILAVGLHCDFARALAEADLLQWERDGVPRHSLAADGLAIFADRVDDRVLRGKRFQSCGQERRPQRPRRPRLENSGETMIPSEPSIPPSSW